MATPINLLFFFSLLFTLCASQQCCQQFSANKCISCPDGMHIYRANCIFNLPHCNQHDGFICTACETGFELDSTKKICNKKVVTPPPPTNDILPGIVVSSAVGTTQVQAGQLQSPAFLQVDSYIRSVYNQELPSPVFIAAFYTNQGFSTNYKVYYYSSLSKQAIYEINLLYDNLRKKVFPIRITKITF